jgi:hypothetical protein
MRKILLLQRLLGAGQGLTVLAFIGILISLIIMFFNPDQLVCAPSKDDLLFMASTSTINLFVWNVLFRISALINIALIFAGIRNMYWAIDNFYKGAYQFNYGFHFKRAAIFLFSGLIFSSTFLNIISFIDHLISEKGSWSIDGSLLTSFFIISTLCLFIYVTGIIVENGKVLKSENDLTV